MKIEDLKDGDYVDVTLRLEVVNGILSDYLRRGYNLSKVGQKSIVKIERTNEHSLIDVRINKAKKLLEAQGFLVTPKDEISPTQEHIADTGKMVDDWIDWSGGDCPVDEGVGVDCKIRDGSIYLNLKANHLCWLHSNKFYDIIKYRLTKS